MWSSLLGVRRNNLEEEVVTWLSSRELLRRVLYSWRQFLRPCAAREGLSGRQLSHVFHRKWAAFCVEVGGLKCGVITV
jgi:hypothetical protein